MAGLKELSLSNPCPLYFLYNDRCQWKSIIEVLSGNNTEKMGAHRVFVKKKKYLEGTVM